MLSVWGLVSARQCNGLWCRPRCPWLPLIYRIAQNSTETAAKCYRDTWTGATQLRSHDAGLPEGDGISEQPLPTGSNWPGKRDEGSSETPEMQIENLKPTVHLPLSPGPEARPLPVSVLSPPRENAAVLCWSSQGLLSLPGPAETSQPPVLKKQLMMEGRIMIITVKGCHVLNADYMPGPCMKCLKKQWALIQTYTVNRIISILEIIKCMLGQVR